MDLITTRNPVFSGF